MTTESPAADGKATDGAKTAWQQVWRKVCLNIDGIAVGSTVAALADHGVLQTLGETDTLVPIDELARRHGAQRAYLHLAMRLLAGQGFVVRERDSAGNGLAGLTAQGRDWLALLPGYSQIPELLDAALRLPDMLRGGWPPEPGLIEALATSASPPVAQAPAALCQRVHLHRLGPGVAASLTSLLRAGVLTEGDSTAVLERRAVNREIAQMALDLLAAQDWVAAENGTWRLTGQGRLALPVAAQYSMALAYLPTFAEAPRRLFPSLAEAAPPEAVFDGHLDRQMDIEFSGEVFSRHCRSPLLDIALPLFHREPMDRQPRLIVDTGCGDGSLLAELYVAVRDHTPRGAALDRYPLLAVGADVSPVARETTQRRLAAAAIPHLVLDGDIGQPDQLAAALAGHGIDMADALHVGKSVIHNRSYRPSREPDAAQRRTACSDAVFIAPDDTLIDAAAMEQNLLEHFRTWRPWTARHGMLMIEGHTLPAAVAAEQVGRSVIAMLDASHGYSRQYPIEAACHRAAAREAGFVTLATRDLVMAGGQPVLTLDYLLPLEPGGLAELLG